MLTTIGILIGSILLLKAVYSFIDGHKFIKTGARTYARVIDIILEIDSNGTLQYIPLFKFTTSNGEMYTFKGFDTCDHYWEVGEETAIIYDPHRPTSAKISSLTGTYGSAAILLICAFPFFTITFVHLLNLI